ncbi:MAG: PQQ-binding-like beta-propeller repeat protein [Bacteroidales bacterium]
MDQNAKINLSRQVMWISGIFCLVVAVLLVANFWQLKKSDPIESKTMEALVERLSQEPNNEELKEEIRKFDLLARKAYFTSTWQVKTGAFLLLFGGILFAFAFKVFNDIQQKINPPESDNEQPIQAGVISHRWILITGTALFALALVAAWFSNDQLSRYLPEPIASANPGATGQGEEIEVIQIIDTTSNTIQEEDTSGLAQQTDESVAIQPETAPEPAVKDETSIKFYGEAEFKKFQATFRGLYGHGISYHKNIPTDWDGATGKNIKWKVALSKPGYNSPVIWGNKIFVAGADEEARIVSCFDKNTGQLIWEIAADNIPGSPSTMPDVTEDTGLSAPTMAVDGNHVYAIFATGDVIAFDLDGNRVWARNLGVPQNHYGHSSSLIVWNNKLVVQYDTGRGGRMLALNIENGETLWDIQRDNQISWSSPILLPKNDKMQVITTSDPYVAGYDLENGQEIWKVEALMGEVGPSAAYDDGLVFATNEYARTVAVNPEPGAEIIWQDDYYLSEASSPVAYNGLLFVATSYGDLVCHDARNGELIWEQHFSNGIYSSPMIADEKLYIIDMEGVMHILNADKSGTVVNEPELGEKAYAIPAFEEGRVYIRGNSALYCIEEN